MGSGVKGVSLYYSFDNATWFKAEYTDGAFTFQAQRRGSVAVRVVVEDYAGNRLEYETYPLAVCSDLSLEMEDGLSNLGQPLHGSLTTLEGKAVNGFAVLLSNGQRIGYVQSTNFSYNAPQNVGETMLISAEFQGSNVFSRVSRQVTVTSTALDVDLAVPSSTFTNTNHTVTVYVHMVYAHDGSPVHGGLVNLEGVAYAETNSSGWACVNIAQAFPGAYWFRAVGVRDSSGRITFPRLSRNFTITWTHIIFDSAYVSDDRADVGSVQCVGFHASWAHNNSDVVGGAIYVNGSAYVTNATGWITFNASSQLVGKQLWTVTGVSCHGITKYEKAVADPHIIWDKVVFKISVADDRINAGETAGLRVSAHYAYDDAPFKGTYSLNDTLTKDGVGKWWFKINSMTDPLYGLTTFETNEAYVIWDRVAVTLSINDDRINVGEPANITWTAIYEYDSTPFSGTVQLNDTTTKSTVGKFGFAVASITDNLYGLTAFTTNEVSCIWDRVDIKLSVPDSRVDVGRSANIQISAVYAFDGAAFTGTVNLNDTEVKNVVGKYGYRAISISDSLYGLTAFTSNSIYVIFDKVTFTLSVADNRISIGDSARISVTAVYAYDNSPFQGSYSLNDTLVKASVGRYGYKVSNITDEIYGLTAFDSNEVWVIFDKVYVVEGGVSDEPAEVGETVTVWFKTVYAYDGAPFDSTQGTLYVNGERAEWSDEHGRWEITCKGDGTARKTFTVTALYSKLHNTFSFEDLAGSQAVRWVYLKSLYKAPVVGNIVQQLDHLLPGYGSIALIGIAIALSVILLTLTRHFRKQKLNACVTN